MVVYHVSLGKIALRWRRRSDSVNLANAHFLAIINAALDEFRLLRKEKAYKTNK